MAVKLFDTSNFFCLTIFWVCFVFWFVLFYQFFFHPSNYVVFAQLETLVMRRKKENIKNRFLFLSFDWDSPLGKWEIQGIFILITSLRKKLRMKERANCNLNKFPQKPSFTCNTKKTIISLHLVVININKSSTDVKIVFLMQNKMQ